MQKTKNQKLKREHAEERAIHKAKKQKQKEERAEEKAKQKTKKQNLKRRLAEEKAMHQDKKQKQKEEHAEAKAKAQKKQKLKREEHAEAKAKAQKEKNERAIIQECTKLEAKATRCNIDTFQSEKVPIWTGGECTLVCACCKALGFSSENRGTLKTPHFGMLCCNENKLRLPFFPELPIALKNLFTDDSLESKHFRNNIRKFNAGMAMASLQVNYAKTPHGGPSAFKIYGQLHRRLGSMLSPQNCKSPNCLQMYFYDAEYQANARASRYASKSK